LAQILLINKIKKKEKIMHSNLVQSVRKRKNHVVVSFGSYLLTGNCDDSTISIINKITSKVEDVIFVGDDLREIILGPDGRFAFVVNNHGKVVLIIDTLNFKTMR